MNRSTVLKAASMAAASGSRTLDLSPPAVTTVDVSEPPPPGRYITEQELEQLGREWHARGFAEGRSAAADQAREEAGQAARRELAEQLEKARAQLTRERAEQMKTLALALAQQLQAMREDLEKQLADWTFVASCRLLGELAPSRIQPTVQQLLKETGMTDAVTVLLHPSDHALLLPTLASQAGDGLAWRADPSLALGGCKLLGPQQTIDARLEVQLEQLRQALDEARREAAVDEGKRP
ncbi:FliH/SctL family protein [Roseateles sp. DB2]|uniref:FliH/SctL family protein n=1 Tax=Roseateles sp. DB2 TaxID=3453717 RepID=UPI003EEC913F